MSFLSITGITVACATVGGMIGGLLGFEGLEEVGEAFQNSEGFEYIAEDLTSELGENPEVILRDTFSEIHEQNSDFLHDKLSHMLDDFERTGQIPDSLPTLPEDIVLTEPQQAAYNTLSNNLSEYQEPFTQILKDIHSPLEKTLESASFGATSGAVIGGGTGLIGAATYDHHQKENSWQDRVSQPSHSAAQILA